ncbi:ATP-binding protein [Agrobacterium sp. SOY23]|uniref:sensor histidine kinase n=1 Tax=Agrobacterium sp. SOY23 TaxID=3014555 RepID=UPI001B1BB9E1|nr:ATP-binding protein [Agrobacterium sp. SOY23]MBO9653613.1 two-component sensor histidine kinase [Agrobacterium tumefaciens]MCZ4431271.1 ATP-binding protein [Agrobacterium sp. SOY23]
MSIASTIFRSREPGGGAHHLAFGLAAVALAAIVFYIDTYTDIESAIAVLYVITVLLAAQAITRFGLIVIASACAILSLLSYAMTHAQDADLQSALRLVVALAALIVTTMLLLKTETARLALLSINAALKESEERYRSIFDRTRVALWERDYSRLHALLMGLKQQGVVDMRAHARANPGFTEQCIELITIVASNEAGKEMLGYDSSISGTLKQSVVSAPDKFLDTLQAIIDNRRVFEDKVVVRTEGGEEKLVLLSISFPAEASSFNRVVVSMVDITQRELALQALAEAQAELTRASKAAAVGAMSASLAHELNQPLGAIVVNAQTLLRWLDRDPPDLGAARRSAERMIRDSQRTSEIIENTRSLLAHTGGKVETFELDDFIDETLVLLEHDLARSGTTVNVEKENTPPVKAVRIELQQVLINLLTNAIQAMDEAGVSDRTIIVRKESQGADNIRVTVRDNGPGIAAEIKEKLFSPFFTTKATGMGMGLSICRTTLETRGGRLEGDNHPLGGAVFAISIPISPEVEHA